MTKVRTAIPIDLAIEVLFSSDNTCCVCRERGKALNLHHIDEDPSNNVAINLALLLARLFVRREKAPHVALQVLRQLPMGRARIVAGQGEINQEIERALLGDLVPLRRVGRADDDAEGFADGAEDVLNLHEIR